MSPRPKKKHILDSVPADDQGSEAFYGFDYQAHVIALMILEMVEGHDVTETVPEYHEDVMQVRAKRPPAFCQIKKRESADAWTIGLLESAIEKLLMKAQYHDVGELLIYGSGRPSAEGEVSLAGLITLLDRSAPERGGEWQGQIEAYVSHFAEKYDSRLDKNDIRRGLELLQIRLTMPHPEAISVSNVKRTIEVLRGVWGVEASFEVGQKAYDAIHKRVVEALKKPKQPHSVKRITVTEARAILRDVLRKEKYVAEDGERLAGSQQKLDRCSLGEYLPYALQMRLDSIQLKFELELSSTDWHDFRGAIGVAWEDFTKSNSGLIGKRLWEELRRLLKKLGKGWAIERSNSALGPEFAEGVFFDMMSICEVDLRCQA